MKFTCWVPVSEPLVTLEISTIIVSFGSTSASFIPVNVTEADKLPKGTII